MFRFFIMLFFTIASCASNASEHTYADFVLVKKSSRTLFLLKDNKILKNYRISLGKNPVGDKIKQGDKKTPEGLYIIDFRNPSSKFHYSLHISYPNNTDKFEAKKKGVNPGGDIFIHGLPNNKNYPDLYYGVDWTDGCIALKNDQIREIARLVPNGTPIQIIK